ncbi:MAG: hypothetical protein QG657_1662 [Acidobacteriota bacterium]|nr:hypothetical protein [Acidobacteriota bacterium]
MKDNPIVRYFALIYAIYRPKRVNDSLIVSIDDPIW